MNAELPHVIIPSDKNKKVLEFCKQISGSTAFYIEVLADVNSDSLDCHNNVRIYREKNGGEIVFGWIIWQHPKIMLEAEFHAVWKSPQNTWLDITPNQMNFRKILFLPDPTHSYDFCGNKRLCNKWYPLTDHPDFQDLINVLRQLFELVEKYPGIGDIELTEEDTSKYYCLNRAKTVYMLNIFAHENTKKRRRKPFKNKKSKG